MSGLVMGRVFYTELPAHLKLTLLALADHAEDDGTGIFVGQARLARKTGAAERSVRGHIAELREMGLIERVGRVGSRGTDRHRIAIERLPTSEQIALMFPSRPATSADRQPAAVRNPSTSSTGNTASRRPAIAVAAEPSVEPSVEPSASKKSSFDEFWRIYPRRQGKGDARRAFAKALRKATLTEVLAGAERLRDDPNLPVDEPSLIPMPATWLNQERWDDDPLPPRRAGPIPIESAATRYLRKRANQEGELGHASDTDGRRDLGLPARAGLPGSSH